MSHPVCHPCLRSVTLKKPKKTSVSLDLPGDLYNIPSHIPAPKKGVPIKSETNGELTTCTGTIWHPFEGAGRKDLQNLYENLDIFWLVVSTHLKKYARQNGFIFPNFRGENKKSLSCHHLVLNTPYAKKLPTYTEAIGRGSPQGFPGLLEVVQIIHISQRHVLTATKNIEISWCFIFGGLITLVFQIPCE